MFEFLKRFRKNMQREIPLVFVHTFRTGERLYTYKPEYYAKISSRYYRNIQVATKNLQNYGVHEKEWDQSVSEIKRMIAVATAGSKDLKQQTLLDINSTMDWFINQKKGIKTAHETLLEFLFCMYYVLDEEKETGYNEHYNDRKIELLNLEPEMRDFFLTNLEKTLGNFMPISRSNTLRLLIQMERIKGAVQFSSTPENLTNWNSQ